MQQKPWNFLPLILGFGPELPSAADFEAVTQTFQAALPHKASSPCRCLASVVLQSCASASHMHLWAALHFFHLADALHIHALQKANTDVLKYSKVRSHCYWLMNGRRNHWKLHFTCSLLACPFAAGIHLLSCSYVLDCICRAPTMEEDIISQRKCPVNAGMPEWNISQLCRRSFFFFQSSFPQQTPWLSKPNSMSVMHFASHPCPAECSRVVLLYYNHCASSLESPWLSKPNSTSITHFASRPCPAECSVVVLLCYNHCTNT